MGDHTGPVVPRERLGGLRSAEHRAAVWHGMGWQPHEVLQRIAADARDTTRGRRVERWAHPDVAHDVCGAMDHDRLTATAIGLTHSPAEGRCAC